MRGFEAHSSLILEQKFATVKQKWFEFTNKPFKKVDLFHAGRVLNPFPYEKPNAFFELTAMAH